MVWAIVLMVYVSDETLHNSNLIINSGFEEMIIPHWMVKNNSAAFVSFLTGTKHSGNRSLRIRNLNVNNRAYYGCNQEIPALTYGSWFYLQSAIKVDNLTGTAGIDIHFLDIRGKRLPIFDAQIAISAYELSQDWTIRSDVFYIPQNTNTLRVAVFIKGTGTVWFDDIILKEYSVDRSAQKYCSQGAYIIQKSNPTIWFEYADQKVFYDTPVPSGVENNKIKITAAGNETEIFQIVIKSERTLKDCNILFSDLAQRNSTILIRNSQLSYHIVGYVDINDVSAPEGIHGMNPDYLVSKNFFDVNKNINTAIWVSLKIPESAQPGLYKGIITIQQERKIISKIPIEIKVWNFTLPPRTHLYTRTNFWLNLIKKYDNRSDTVITYDYFNNILNHRINTFSNVELNTSIKERNLDVAFKEFDQLLMKMFDTYGFEAVTVGPFFGDASGWNHRNKWMNIDLESLQFEHLFKQYCVQLENHLKNKGWLDRCWLYFWDEPQLDDPGFLHIVRIGKIIKKVAPDLKIFMTKYPIPDLYDIVDIWCLPFNEQYFHTQYIRARKIYGDKIFVYHNDPYIDTPLIDKRIYAWRYKIADIDGVYAWWNLTFWQNNPYVNPYMIEQKANGSINQLRPGNGVLLYPNTNGAGPPVNSLRWEIFHQGLEDYEYFWLLEQAIKRAMTKLKILPEFADYANYRINEYLHMVIYNYFNNWNRDVRYLYTIRSRIATEIQSIEQEPIALIKTIPQEGPLEPGKIIKIIGLTEPAITVIINSECVSVTDEGTFTANIKNPTDGVVSIKLIRGSKEKILKRHFK